MTELDRTHSLPDGIHVLTTFDRSSAPPRVRVGCEHTPRPPVATATGPATVPAPISRSQSRRSRPRSAGSIAGSGASAVSLDRHVTSPSGTHTLVITSAAVSLSRLELATVDSAGCADDDHPEHDDDRCHELETGPMLVDLPTDNSVVSVLSLQLPAGTYRALEAKIRPVRTDDNGGSRLPHRTSGVRERERARGRARSTERRSRTPARRTHRWSCAFDPPITVGSTATTVTVHVSIDRWFTDGGGNLIDPSHGQRRRRERAARSRQRAPLIPRLRGQRASRR